MARSHLRFVLGILLAGSSFPVRAGDRINVVSNEPASLPVSAPKDSKRSLLDHFGEGDSLYRTLGAESLTPHDVETEHDQIKIDLLSEHEIRIAELEKQLKKQDDADKRKDEKFPTFSITGFTQLDTAFYHQTPENIATVGDAQDGTGFRRARFGVVGKAAEFTNYMFEFDFATAGRPSFFDVWVEQANLPYLGTVRIGQYCQPFSVDAMSGFRVLPFLERSLPFLAFVPFRRVGAMAYDSTADGKSTWAASLYRTGGFNNAPLGENRFAMDFGDVGGYGFSGRATHLLHYDEPAADRYLWQIGGSYNFAQLSANDAFGSGMPGNAGSPRPFYQARTAPEFGSLGYLELGGSFGSAVNGTPSFVDTGRYEARFYNMFGLETVYQAGALSFQSEYMGTVVDSVAGSVYYHGAYAEVMYRLTGEHRVYDKKSGTLRNPTPFTDFIPLKRDGICGWGAWEVAGRWSFVDLRNPSSLDGHYYNSATNTFTGTSKAGNGILHDSTLGVSWFVNAHAKIQFNWIHAMLENTAKGYSQADLFVSRVQVDF